jgi:hypothetical protein
MTRKSGDGGVWCVCYEDVDGEFGTYKVIGSKDRPSELQMRLALLDLNIRPKMVTATFIEYDDGEDRLDPMFEGALEGIKLPSRESLIWSAQSQGDA